MENFNCLANLQLIEGLPNLEKSDKEFSDWVDENYPNEHERKDYMRKHYIPDVNLGLDDFDNFITERKKLMTQAFRAILNVSPHPESLISPLEP